MYVRFSCFEPTTTYHIDGAQKVYVFLYNCRWLIDFGTIMKITCYFFYFNE